MDAEKKDNHEPKPPLRMKPIYLGNEKLWLTFSDLLTLTMIIVDMLYWGGNLSIASGYMITGNIAVVFIAYISYEMKRRVKKRTLRKLKRVKDEATSQESQR